MWGSSRSWSILAHYIVTKDVTNKWRKRVKTHIHKFTQKRCVRLWFFLSSNCPVKFLLIFNCEHKNQISNTYINYMQKKSFMA
uniref:Uncharacterized protein n=1 Tax=Populus trichocarpa TaxID=3694 RepID=A0A2K2B3B8_POPTR